jgi:hypothetical protein
MERMEKRLQPKYDPLQIFAGSKTPAGLYARQKWRHEEDSDSWRRDFSETVKGLRAGQLGNGSWNNSVITTIRKLFGLHLTVREPDEAIGRALDWFLSDDNLWTFKMMPHQVPDDMYEDISNKINEKVFHSLPFSNGCFGHLAICAGLFLADCFGRGEKKKVTRLYNMVAKEIEERGGHWCSIGCTNNALRAFIKHARYSKSRTTEMMVDYLGSRQLVSGKWKGQTPFYMTLNALAHLDAEDAKHQCRSAVEVLLQLQNRDGSWGSTQKEWDTFLVVHALNRLNE